MKPSVPHLPLVKAALLYMLTGGCLLLCGAHGASAAEVASPAAGSGYQFIHLTKESDALAYNGIRAIVQDRKGFVWIGTHKGLSRYDGTRFKNYDRSDFGIDSDYIISLSEDLEGNIWIGTDNGTVIYRYSSDSFGKLDIPQAPSDRIFSIVTGPDGDVWIGSRAEGLFRYSHLDGSLRHYPQSAYRIALISADRVWVASYCDNIYELDASTSGITPIATDLFEGDDVSGIIALPKSDFTLYVASKRHGLCSVDTRNGTVTTLVRLKGDQRPIDLSQSGGRQLLMSTTDGLVGYDTVSGEVSYITSDPSDRFSLSDNYVTCAAIDSKDGLWVGTFNGGLNYFGQFQNSFTKISRTLDGVSLGGSMVSGFTQDGSGTVWVSTLHEGLLRYDPVLEIVERYANPGIPSNITALCSDGDHIWIGAQRGVFRMHPGTSRIVHYPLPVGADDRVVSLFRSSEGVIFVCTAVGVLRYDRASDRFRTVDELGPLAVEGMAEDAAGDFWLASYSSGVFHWTREGLKNYCSRTSGDAVPEMISSVCADAKGRIWVASFSSGLYRLKGSAFEKVLDGSVMFSAVPDEKGHLWVSTDAGLIDYDPDGASSRVFTTSDGLLENEFVKSGLRLRDGSIVMGSGDGFIHFRPESFLSAPSPSEVRITDFRISGESVSPGDGSSDNIDIASRVRLKPRQRSFSFDIATPDAPSFSGNRIICSLDDRSTDITSSKSIDFYNVTSGTHLLRIETLSPDGARRPSHRDLEIEVQPRFFESLWGWLLLSAVALSVIALVCIYLYRKAVREQKRSQEEYERQRDAQLFEEKMDFFSNVIHEIKTPLTLIKSPLRKVLSAADITPEVREDLQVVDNSSEYLDRLVKELLDFVRVEKHGYRLEIGKVDIVQRLGFLCFNFQDTARSRNIRLDYRHDEDCIYVDADASALDKILNNLLGNAVKYAESYVDVHAYQEGTMVSVTVRNDGAAIPEDRREEIFKPFVCFPQDSQPYSNSFGIGLTLSRNLVHLHGGTLFLDSDTTCTKFVMRLPSQVGEGGAYRSPQDDMDEYVRSSEAPLIVVAEDNAELSRYMTRKLEASSYRVLPVPCAEDALPLLRRYDVSLLITDIAMRQMSGVELCSKVSSDMETSHIPVIVLSAISDNDIKIRCMENGASLYLEKPFDMDYLESCIRNILEARKRFSATSMEDSLPEGMDIPDMDGRFLRNLEAAVMDNISDPDLSARQLEELLFMSHSTLNRKVKALLGTTPNEYIRSRRLALASRMLQSDGARVNEVCYAVGFKSPSYFSKCFKARYGVLPGEFKGDR